MRHRLCTAIVLLGLVASMAHAQTRGAVDWVFLVDTSASMRGAGGTKNIFEDVKSSIKTFVSEANDGDSIAVFAFDRDVHLKSATPIDDNARRDLASIVDDLQANGNRTHLGLAIQEGLARARQTGAKRDRERAVVLFTDGREDVRGIADPVSILGNVRQVGDSHVFFVSMGEHEPQLDDFVRQTSRSQVLRAPSREAIRDVAQKIRAILTPPAPPPPPLRIELSPAEIAFGRVTAGQPSLEQSLTIATNRPAHVKLIVSAPPGIDVHVPEAVDVRPGTPVVIKLQASVADDAIGGAKQLSITAANATTRASIEVVPPSLAMRIAKIVVPIAVLLAIAFALFANHRRRNRLEGAIEILEPRLPSDSAYVGLPQLQANEIALSTIVPPDALGGSDARLFVRRRDGRKKVWIAARAGSLHINDVETPVGELFDADTIRVGAAKLRFNRTGDERPITTEEEA